MNNSKVVREIYTKVKENGKPTIARLRQIKKFDDGGKTIVIDSKITEVAKVCDAQKLTSSVCLLSEYPEKSFTSILFKKLHTNAEISHSGHTFSSDTQVNHTTVCGEQCGSSELRWPEVKSQLEPCGSSDIRQSRPKGDFVSTKSSCSPVTTTCCTYEDACTTTGTDRTDTQGNGINPIADQDVHARRNEIKKKIQQVINLLRVKPLMPMRQRVEYYRQSSASSSCGSSSSSNYSSLKVRRTNAIRRSKRRHLYSRRRDSSNESQDSCFKGSAKLCGNSTDSGKNTSAQIRDSMIDDSKNMEESDITDSSGSDDYFSESVTAITPTQSDPFSQSGPFSQSEPNSENDPNLQSDPISQNDSISQYPTAKTARTDTLSRIDEISQMNGFATTEANHRSENPLQTFLGDGDGCMTHSSSNKSQNATSVSASTIDLASVCPSSDGDGTSLEKKLKKIIAVLVRNVCSEKVIGDGLENIDKINMNVQFSFHKNDEIKDSVSAVLG